MKKTVLSILAAALCVSSMFAEEKKPEIKVSGFLRAGAAAKFADGENTFDTSKWYPGIYFSGDSTGTRFRLNLDAKTKLENGNTVQAFGRFEFDDKLAKNIDDGQAWKETIKYANVNVGLFGDILTVAAGKLKKPFTSSVGFEEYSFFDQKTGVALGVVPIEGLTISATAAVAENESIKLEDAWYVGGIKYTNSGFKIQAQGASKGIILASVGYFGEAFTIAAEQKFALTDDGKADNKAIMDGKGATLDGDVWFEYKGVENLKVGLLVFDKYDKDDEAFTLKVVPAVRYNVTELLGLSLEVEYCQTFSDADLTPYVAFIPNVSFNVTTNISASLWGVISTDAAQKANMVGIGAIVNF